MSAGEVSQPELGGISRSLGGLVAGPESGAGSLSWVARAMKSAV